LQAIQQMVRGMSPQSDSTCDNDNELAIGLEQDGLTWCHVTLIRWIHKVQVGGAWRGTCPIHPLFFQEIGPEYRCDKDAGTRTEWLVQTQTKLMLIHEVEAIVLNLLLVFGADLYFLVQGLGAFDLVLTFWLQLGGLAEHPLRLQIPRACHQLLVDHPLYDAHKSFLCVQIL
jgi:hypothetical protein